MGSGDLPAEAERVLRQRCLADSTSEHARRFDSRTPQPFAAPSQFLFRKPLLRRKSFHGDDERRFLLRCESDAAFFHLYLGTEDEWRKQPAALTQSFPTPRDAVSYIMDTFPIVKRKDEARTEQKNAEGEVVKPGRYITKDTILEIYDALGESIKTGQPYQTGLNPPPADARCCHPPKAIR